MRRSSESGQTLFGHSVVTLEDLAHSFLTGSLSFLTPESRTLLTPTATALLIYRSAQRLESEAGLKLGAGRHRAMVRAVTELREAQISSKHVIAAIELLQGEADSSEVSDSKNRLSKLARLLETYEKALQTGGLLDPSEALREGARRLKRGAVSDRFRVGDQLHFAGFSELSGARWDLALALCERAASVKFDLPYSPERPEDGLAVEPLLRRIEALGDAQVGQRIELSFAYETMDKVGKRWLRADAATPEEEALALADAARSAIDQGASCDEMVLFGRRRRAECGLLSRAFAERGLLVTGLSDRPLLEAPAVKAAMAHLIAGAQWSRTSAERLFDSGWLSNGVAGLGALLDRAGAFQGRGDPEVWLHRAAARLEGAELAARRLDELRRVLAPLQGSHRASAWPERLWQVLSATGAIDRAEEDETAALDRLHTVAQEASQAWQLVVDAIPASPAAELPLAATEWMALLHLFIEPMRLRDPNESIEGAIQFLTLEEAPGTVADIAFLFGCDEGRAGSDSLDGRGLEGWPAEINQEGWLRDADRLLIQKVAGKSGGPLELSARLAARTLHQAACALWAGRQAAVVGWCSDTEGNSGPARALRKLSPSAPEKWPRPQPSLYRSPTELLVELAQGELPLDRIELADSALVSNRIRSVERRVSIEAERLGDRLFNRAGPFTGGVGGAAAELKARLPPEWSASQFEQLANCSFQFFLQKLLDVPDQSPPQFDLDARLDGELLHRVVERLLSARLEVGHALSETAEALAEAEKIALQVLDRAEAAGEVGHSAIWAGQRDRLLRRVRHFVLTESRRSDGLAPTHLELSFGGGGEVASLELPNSTGGAAIKIRGRIDRIDVGAEKVSVIDYKSARDSGRLNQKLKAEELGEGSFQMPIYALVAAREFPKQAQLEGRYWLLGGADPARSSSSHWNGRENPHFLALSRTALAEARAAGERTLVDAIGKLVDGTSRGDFAIRSRDCGYCRFGAICRSEGQTAQQDNESGGEA